MAITKISTVSIRNFKRFEETTFTLPGDNVVIAGPNNTGKTTLLQAIAAWELAYKYWWQAGDMNVRTGYKKVPITRQVFSPVSLPSFDSLWSRGVADKRTAMEITLSLLLGSVGVLDFPIEIQYDSVEQIYVRPKNTVVWNTLLGEHKDISETGDLIPDIAYIPAMTGLSVEEPVYQPAKIEQLLGLGRPGEVLRNLLAGVYDDDKVGWKTLCEYIKDIFDYEMLPPNTSGANIRAQYRDNNGTTLDIISAGSGFLQVLMLLTFLSARKSSILLLDEPDAHLHILLQDRVYNALKRLAGESQSMLIMATHSERIINAVDPHHLCVLLDDKPRMLVDKDERRALIDVLKVVDNTDIMLANNAPGVLYLEGHTDLAILREWARVLGHPLIKFLEQPFWKPAILETGGDSIQSANHFRALRLANPDIVGVKLQDGDGKNRNTSLEMNESGVYRFAWKRYEIESYLIHPESIINFIKDFTGQDEAAEKAKNYMENNFPPAINNNPLAEHDYLNNTKAKDILAKIFEEAGIPGMTDYARLAAAMSKEAIHSEVIEKLDAIAKVFKIE